MFRLTIGLAVVVAGLSFAFSRGNAPAQTPDCGPEGKLALGGTACIDKNPVTVTRTSSACARQPIRRRVVDRRSATWRWQDELGEARLRTAYAERRATGCAYLRWTLGLWAGRADKRWRLYSSLREPEAAIRYVFGRYADQALAVSWCESHRTTYAENGQYLGLFQMGSYARSTYGHGSSALDQARAAYRYFVASGRDWSPWSCKPW